MSRAPCIACMSLHVILAIAGVSLVCWISADVAARIERERWRDACNTELTLSSHHIEHYVCRRVQ